MQDKLAYVGYVEEFICPLGVHKVKITECHNIRYWGTDKGFGQLGIQGKQKETDLDECPNIIVPYSKVLVIMDIFEDAQKTFYYNLDKFR